MGQTIIEMVQHVENVCKPALTAAGKNTPNHVHAVSCNTKWVSDYGFSQSALGLEPTVVSDGITAKGKTSE